MRHFFDTARTYATLAALNLLVPSIVLAAGVGKVTNPLGEGTTFCGLVTRVLDAAMIIGAPIAVLLIVYVGAQFVFAQGAQDKLTKARNSFFTTVVGILIFFGASLIAKVIMGTLTSLGVQGLGAC